LPEWLHGTHLNSLTALEGCAAYGKDPLQRIPDVPYERSWQPNREDELMTEQTSNIYSVEIFDMLFHTSRNQEFCCSARVKIQMRSSIDPSRPGAELSFNVGLASSDDAPIQVVERDILNRSAEILAGLAGVTGPELLEIQQKTRADLAYCRD
jgi:hypothetical protein